MKYVKLFLFSAIFLVGVGGMAQSLNAQSIVKGTVTDQGGQGIQGVNVSVKNSKERGVVTDAQGNFSISAKVGEVLLFTHVSYKEQEIIITSLQNKMSVSLEQNPNQLSEVVVIGYGTVKRKDLTGSVASIKASDMTKSTDMSLNGTLQGKASGVSVVSNEGAPGADVSVYIRAGSSISAGNEPLYVIDGFPQLGGSNLNINVNDVESVEILKDASATAIYGSRGANGVIIITTKIGKTGKFSINYDGYYSLQQLGVKRKVMNSVQYAEMQHYLGSSPRNSELGDSLFSNWQTYNDSVNFDWQDAIYRLAGMQSHNLSFSGGTSQLKMMGSLNFTDQDGIARGTNYKRYSARLNTIANVTKFITSTTNIALTMQDRTGTSLTGEGGINYSAVKGSPYKPSGMNLNQYLIAHGMPPGGTYGRDPLVDLLEPDIKRLNYYVSLNSSLSFKLMEGLTFKISGGMNYIDDAFNYFYGVSTSQGLSINGIGRKNNSVHIGLINENTLNYTKSFGTDSKLDAVAGFSFQKEINTFTNVYSQEYAIEALGYNSLSFGSQYAAPNSGKSVSGINSYFGRAQYSLHDKYLITGTIRADGSSKFPVHKWGYFPSGGVAWKVSDEKFMSQLPYVSNLKLRLTYGLTGNESIAPYSSYTSYGASPILPVFDNASVVGVVPAQLGSDDLKWETTIQQDLGFDIGLFNDRIQITADAYIKKSRDLLLAAPIPNYSGFTSVTRNVGDMQVKGLEIALNTLNFNGKKFKWNTNFNIAFNKTKVLSLNEGQEFFYLGSVQRFRNIYAVKVGESLGSIYGYVNDGVINTQEELAATPRHTSLTYSIGSRKYKDISGPNGKPDGIVNALDQTVIGNGNPKFFGGFTNDFSYGPFELSLLFTYSYGNDILNADKALYTMATQFQGGTLDLLSRWTPRTPQINGQRWGTEYNNEYNDVSSYLVEDGSFLRLKNIQLAYNMKPELLKKISVKSLRVYFTAQNLLTFTHYTGYDPEVNFLNSIITPGADLGAYPRSKVYTIGLNLAF